MIEFLAERFAPGPVFAWVCAFGLLLIPLIWWRYLSRKRRVFVRFSATQQAADVGQSWATRIRWIIPVLRTLAVLAFIVALARPQSAGAYRDKAYGIAIQMVLDVSGSMSEEDFRMGGRWVRRLDAVKQVFHDFVLGDEMSGGRDNDLIGMTTFAKFAETVCPLTLDHASLIELLKSTEIPGWLDGRQIREVEEAGFTSLGDAIVLGTDDLRRAGEQASAGVPGAEAAKSRVMILLTDGADNPPQFRGATPPPDPKEAAELAAELGIKIYTIGAVGSGGQRRQPFDFFAPRGREVDEPALKEIARVTGGRYFRATDTDSLRTIYAEINELERRKTGERAYRDNVRAATIAMCAGLGLLLLELMLTQTRFRSLP